MLCSRSSARSATSTLRRSVLNSSSGSSSARQAPLPQAPQSISSHSRSSIISSSSAIRNGPSEVRSRALQRMTQARGYASSSSGGGSEKAKNRAAIGPFSVPAAVLFVLTGGGLLWYFQSEKAKVEERRKQETSSAKVGRPRIGGPFKLTAAGSDASGKPVGATITHEDLLGSFSLIYFGFTNCPDICPEELDKMSEVVDYIEKQPAPYGGAIVQPVFISCDPARDTVAMTAKYIADFHPRLLGLTGDYEDVKAACKAYRVYFSTPPGADPNGDYLVDHSIFFYLMDPEGRFVDAFGRSAGPEETRNKVVGYVKQWVDSGNEVKESDVKKKIFEDPSRKVEA